MYYTKKILIIFSSLIISIFLCEFILKLDDSYVLPETFNYNFNDRIYSFTNEIFRESNKEEQLENQKKVTDINFLWTKNIKNEISKNYLLFYLS